MLVTTTPDITTWVDATEQYTRSADIDDPVGGTAAYRVLEQEGGSGQRYLYRVPLGPASEPFHYGPVEIDCYVRPISGASVWIGNGGWFDYQFVVHPDGSWEWFTYSNYGDAWVEVTPASNGYFHVRAEWWSEGQIRNYPSLSTISNTGTPPDAIVGQGFDVYEFQFIQRQVLALDDRIGSAALSGLTHHRPANTGFCNQPVLWHSYGESYGTLATTDAALCAAISGGTEATILILARRHWDAVGTSDALMHAVASSGNALDFGATPRSTLTAGAGLYAGAYGTTGPVSETPLNQEWQSLALVLTRVDSVDYGTIYAFDLESGLRLMAGPTEISRGTIASVAWQFWGYCVREAAVFSAALSDNRLLAQGIGMIARAQIGYDTMTTGTRHQCQTVVAPWSIRDDSGVCYTASNQTCWVFGGAVGTTVPSNDVYASTDLGVTWTQVTQVTPFDVDTGFQAFAVTVGGTEWIYLVNTCNATPKLWRSLASDGAHWEVVSAIPVEGLMQFSVGITPDGSTMLVCAGQTSFAPPITSPAVLKSTDYGETWTALANAPFDGRSCTMQLSWWQGEFWLVSGVIYDSSIPSFTASYRDVWSFDPTTDTWTLRDSEAPFPGAAWSRKFVLGNRLHVLGGRTIGGSPTNYDVPNLWSVDTGGDWRQEWPHTWRANHADSAIEIDANRVLLAPHDWQKTVRLLTVP